MLWRVPTTDACGHALLLPPPPTPSLCPPSQVYLNYDGACASVASLTTMVKVQVEAEYDDYQGCGDGWLAHLTGVMTIAIIIFAVPVTCFLLVLAAPTLW